MKNKKGIALILAIGILALLAVIATSFALNMRLEYKATKNYYNGVKARYLAEAAIQEAIAQLREHVKSSAFDYFNATDERWAESPAYTSDISGDDATSNIEDEQRKLNINNCSSALLENLILVLTHKGSNPNSAGVDYTISSDAYSAELDTGEGTAIGDNKPVSDYINLEEIIAQTGGAVDEAELELLEPFFTTYSYEDPNSSNRSPINVNTADKAVIAAVLMTDSGLSGDNAWGVAGDILGARETLPFTIWRDFNTVIDGAVGTYIADLDEADTIKNNCNPNRTANKTKFCFNSGGVYTIAGTGTVGPTTDPLATKTVTAVVKIYDIYNETTKDQFELGMPDKVTWLDSCPIDSSELFDVYTEPGNFSSGIPDSIKLGFWDDFEDSSFSGDVWTAATGTCEVSDGKLTVSNWGKYVLTNPANTSYDELGRFKLRVYEDTANLNPNAQMREVGQILFWGTGPLITPGGSIVVFHAMEGELEWWGGWAYELDPIANSGIITFLSNSVAQGEPYNLDPNNDKYVYNPQIRILNAVHGGTTDPCHDTSEYQTSLSASTTKVHSISTGDGSATVTIHTPAATGTSFSRTGLLNGDGNTSGKIGLYGQSCIANWDDIRIIPSDGNFVSQTINLTGYDVGWGTVTATVTIPSTANASSETVALETSADDGANWHPSNSTTYQINTASATSIQYKAILSTNNADIKETPALEDITITYLPKVQILAWKVK